MKWLQLNKEITQCHYYSSIIYSIGILQCLVTAMYFSIWKEMPVKVLDHRVVPKSVNRLLGA